jgi:hypothetical protein
LLAIYGDLFIVATDQAELQLSEICVRICGQHAGNKYNVKMAGNTGDCGHAEAILCGRKLHECQFYAIVAFAN